MDALAFAPALATIAAVAFATIGTRSPGLAIAALIAVAIAYL